MCYIYTHTLMNELQFSLGLEEPGHWSTKANDSQKDTALQRLALLSSPAKWVFWTRKQHFLSFQALETVVWNYEEDRSIYYIWFWEDPDPSKLYTLRQQVTFNPEIIKGKLEQNYDSERLGNPSGGLIAEVKVQPQVGAFRSLSLG